MGPSQAIGRRALLGAGALSGVGLALRGCTSDGSADSAANRTTAGATLAPGFDRIL